MLEGEIVENYEINESTLALIAMKNKTAIYEENQTFFVNQTPNKIMETSCRYYGSTLEGRQKGTENLIGINYKAPVIVEESRELIFFPTSSPRKEGCSWISLNHINQYFKSENKMIILFHNGSKLVLDLSYCILDKQILRAARLESVLRSRKISKN